MKIRYILLSIIIILELIVIGFLVFDNDTKECISNNEVVPVLEEKEETNEEEIISKIKVDIKGAVVTPGVYELEENKRVIDVINLAGGLKDNPNLDNFYAAYENLVSKEISGELTPSISIYRENKRGNIEYRIYYLVNEDKALESRIRAMKNALVESEVARMNAEQISKFIKEGFDF